MCVGKAKASILLCDAEGPGTKHQCGMQVVLLAAGA
jgi:hypothetical protein